MGAQTSRNVDISRNSNCHISVLREARVTWSSMLLVLHVLRMLMMTLTTSKVKVMGFWSSKICWKLHFSMSISSAIMMWSSKLMVDSDSMGPSLQLVIIIIIIIIHSFLYRHKVVTSEAVETRSEPNFRIPLSESYHLSSNFAECRYYTNFKWPYFRTARGYGHMVRHAGNPICIVHTDVTLTWCKVKVKVTDLLKLQKLHLCVWLTSSTILAWRSQLMGDYDTVGLQLLEARFLHFSTSCQTRDFEIREMLISPESTAFYLRAGRG